MPVYNGVPYIKEAIQSVLNQTYTDFKLFIVDDGSTDNSKYIVLSFQDSRIRYFEQENKGVSSARNVGLNNMQGDYFCFLDADDVLPSNSLEARLKVFEDNPSLTFVDGSVLFKDETLSQTNRIYRPRFTGNPLAELLRLNDSCFACPSWMIKRTKANAHICMNEKITHSEDLLFYMEHARLGGVYGYTPEVVLQYRQHPHSAMRNLEALERGYWQVYDHIKDWEEFTPDLKRIYRYKVKKFMMLDYLKCGKYANAFSTLLK